jgi:glycosidase
MLEDLHKLTEATNAFIFSESNPPEEYKEWREKIYRAARSDKHAMINSTLNGMPWNADTVMNHLEEFYGMLHRDDIASYQTSCHDVYTRTVDRIGEEQARNAALLNLTLPGIPWLYYGDELGMHGQTIPYDFTNPFQNLTFMRFGYDRTKNPSRLSMAWDGSENAGFTTGTAVLPVHTDYKTHNVQVELMDPHSMLRLHQRLTDYRRENETIQIGTFNRIDTQNSAVGAYTLNDKLGELRGVIINFTDTRQPISLDIPSARIAMTSQPGEIRRGEEISLKRFTLPPNQAIIFEP